MVSGALLLAEVEFQWESVDLPGAAVDFRHDADLSCCADVQMPQPVNVQVPCRTYSG